MTTLKKYIALLALACICAVSNSAWAQLPKVPNLPKLPVTGTATTTDSAKKDSVPKVIPRSKIKSYASVINKGFVSNKGLFGVHKSKDRDQIYFEIPDSILHRDIMVINRLTKSPAGSGMYPGEELDEKTIQFEIGPDSTVRIRYHLVVNEGKEGSQISKAVDNASINPIAVSFPIVAYGKTHHSYVIDVTKFLKDKSFINSIDGNTQLAKFVSLPTMKDFYVEYIHAYPINVEISISKNFDAKKVSSPPDPVTIQTTTSFIALPKEPLRRRFSDPRIGYFADYYYAYSDDQQKSEQKQFILHWRLEPKDADIDKWKRGELVEPKKPIVIYIDPATPKQWRPYLIQGINDWQKAFEQAGFKNAIWGKEWPENDTTMHMDDARYSMINYFPSEVQNAYGPQVHDPRSGEIIQTHIGWYHNVMSLLHSWYMVQASAVDPQARKAKFDDALMGNLIRFVSSHEVGHTLGLRHNFGSSSQTPVDSLRSKHYLDVHGHTASIMDYARFNYVAQPEDHIPQIDLFPRIGEYDKWAVQWGYGYVSGSSAEEDAGILSKLTTEKNSKNPRLYFGNGESADKKADPRNLREDLSDNAMKASTYGIKNLKRILPNISAWTFEENDLNENVTDIYKQIQQQYFRYMGHVLTNVAGVYYTVRTDAQKQPTYLPVPKSRQKEALAFFDAQLFTTPTWLLNSTVLSHVNIDPTEPNFIEDTQVKVLNSLMDVTRINSVIGYQKRFGAAVLGPDEYIGVIHHIIFKDLKQAGAVKIDSYHRNLQKSYLQNILTVLTGKDEANNETDASSVLKADMYALNGEIKQAITRSKDPMTVYHLKDLQSRIKELVKNK